MKTSPAEVLRADLPKTRWGKILGATPVVMTVVATLLAGLSSSEMTRAQYDRSLAAQLQSKAGDQWSFFQAKKLRSAMQNTTLDTVAALTDVGTFDIAALTAALGEGAGKTTLESAAGRDALAILEGQAIPEPPSTMALDPKIARALGALEASESDSVLNAAVLELDGDVLEKTLRAARERALALDEITKPLTRAVETMERELVHRKNSDAGAAAQVSLARGFTIARLSYNARRYDLEARYNQSTASLYELEVRKNNLSAERHHRRSGRFFYGMLAAQMGVIIATFAMAAHKRSFLWSIAAAAGVAAVSFAVYVYLFV